MYFSELPKGIQDLVKNKILAAYQDNTNDAYPYGEDALSEVECHSRDGFTAFRHNKGGIQARGFQDLLHMWGSGSYPNNDSARKTIEESIEYNFKALAESTYAENKELFDSLKVKPEDCRYHTVQTLIDKHPELEDRLAAIQRQLENYEPEYLSGDENSIMYEIRFMYHGIEKGIHSASVSVVINTEAPYFRSSISWMPGLKCEHGKEVEITWKTVNGLKTKLNKALTKLVQEVL